MHHGHQQDRQRDRDEDLAGEVKPDDGGNADLERQHAGDARRFALLGDAAVGMHPTTAHGFNFGLLGQHALARELCAAVAAGRDVADPAALRRYEAAHRGETRLFFLAAEAVMRLYATGDSLPARLLRDTALRLGNLPPLRQALTARMRDPDLDLVPRVRDRDAGERPGQQ